MNVEQPKSVHVPHARRLTRKHSVDSGDMRAVLADAFDVSVAGPAAASRSPTPKAHAAIYSGPGPGWEPNGGLRLFDLCVEDCLSPG
jgi:hypothetical protein